MVDKTYVASASLLPPIDSQIILRDRITGSPSYTSSNIVSVEAYEINGLSGVECFLSFTQESAPALNDTRFSASLPLTIDVGDFAGLKQVYLWCKFGSNTVRATNFIFLRTVECENAELYGATKDFKNGTEGFSNNIVRIQSVPSSNGDVLTLWQEQTAPSDIYGRIDNEGFAKELGPKKLLSADYAISTNPTRIDLAPDLSTGGWVLSYMLSSVATNSATASGCIYFTRIDPSLSVSTGTFVDVGSRPRIDVSENGSVSLVYRKPGILLSQPVYLTSFSPTNSVIFTPTVVLNPAGADFFGDSILGMQDVVVEKISGDITVGHLSRKEPFRITRYDSAGNLKTPNATLDLLPGGSFDVNLANRYGSSEVVAYWLTATTIAFTAVTTAGAQKYSNQAISRPGLINGNARLDAAVTSSSSTLAVDPRIVFTYFTNNITGPGDLHVYVYSDDSTPTFERSFSLERSDSRTSLQNSEEPHRTAPLNDSRFRVITPQNSPGLHNIRFEELDLEINQIRDNQFYLTYNGQRKYANSTAVVANLDCPILGQDYLFSESQTTIPSTSHPGFQYSGQTLSFTNFILTSYVGLHTVYLWTKTSTASVNSAISLATIYLSQLALPVPFETEIVLKDRITGSYYETNSTVVSVEISETNNNLASLVFFVSETQSTAPTTSDLRFISTAPQTFAVASGLGIRTLYLWHKEPSESIIGSYNSIFLNPSFSCATAESFFITKELDRFEENVLLTAKGLCMSTSTSHRVLSVWLDEKTKEIIGRVDGPDFAKEIGPRILVTNVSTWNGTIAMGGVSSNTSWIDACEDLSTGGWVITYTKTINVYYKRIGPNLEDLSGTDKFVFPHGTNPRVGVDEGGNVVVAYRQVFQTSPNELNFTHFTKFDSADTVTVPDTIVTAIATTGLDMYPPIDPEVLVHKQSGKFVVAQTYQTSAGGLFYPVIQLNRYTSAGALESSNATTQIVDFASGNNLIGRVMSQQLHLAGRYGSDEIVVGWSSFIFTQNPNNFFQIYDSAGNAKTPIITVGPAGQQAGRQSNLCIASPTNTTGVDSKVVFRVATGSVGSGNSRTFIYANSSPATHLATVVDNNGNAAGMNFVDGRLALTAINEDQIRYMVPFFEGADISRIKEKEINLIRTNTESEIVLQDQAISSTVTTRLRTVDVELDCPVWGASYFLSETLTTAPISTNPSFITIGGVLESVEFQLTADLGLHTVFAWYKNAGIVNSQERSAAIFLLPLEQEYSASAVLVSELGQEYSASAFLFTPTGPMVNELDYTASVDLQTAVQLSYSGSGHLQSTVDAQYSASAEIEGTETSATWSFVLKPGNNLISAPISASPGLTAKDFVTNSAADFFFYESSGILGVQFGNFIHANQGNPNINIPLKAATGYITVLNSSFAGLVRTVSITGTAWSN